MEHKKAIEVLKSLLEKHPLDSEEKEAVTTAIGVLGWTSLSQSHLEARKSRRERSTQW